LQGHFHLDLEAIEQRLADLDDELDDDGNDVTDQN
jgi:hypothetical protein